MSLYFWIASTFTTIILAIATTLVGMSVYFFAKYRVLIVDSKFTEKEQGRFENVHIWAERAKVLKKWLVISFFAMFICLTLLNWLNIGS